MIERSRMQCVLSDLEYASKKRGTQRDKFLGALEIVAPWSALLTEIEPFYPGRGRGRPRPGLEPMLRMCTAQQCMGLSAEATENAIYDSQAVRTFIGIDLGRKAAPAATTRLKFRRRLETHQRTERVFASINGHMEARG